MNAGTSDETTIDGIGVRRMAQDLVSRKLGLWGLFALQAVCAAFLLGDAIADITGFDHSIGARDSDILEYAIVLALILGTVFIGLEIRRLMDRNRRMEDQLKAASGAFSALLDDHFEKWALTPSERDVALLAIKGLSNGEIAELRQTREGTIKAQCNAIFRKAGVSGRPQLLSLFVEELMGEGIVGARSGSAAEPAG